MKANYAIIFLALVALTAAQTAAPPPNCKASNVFRSKLEANYKGLVLAKPDTATGSCNQEWSTYGTCCKVSNLKTIAEKDQKAIQESYQILSSEFANFLGLFRTFYLNLKTLAVANETQWKKPYQKNAIKQAQSLLVDEQFVRIFDTLADYAKEKAWNNYKKMMKNCWEYHIKIRSAALCSTCSGRGSEFFKNNKAIASEKACAPVMRKCYRSIKATLRIFRGWRFLNGQANIKLKHLEVVFNSAVKLPNLKNLITTVDEGGVAQDIENISFDFKQMIKDNYQHKGRFCDKFVKLQETPLVVLIARNIKQGKDWVLGFKPRIMEIITGNVLEEGDTKLSDIQKKIKAKRAQIKGDDEPDDLEVIENGEDRQLHVVGSRALLLSEAEALFQSDAIWIDDKPDKKTTFIDMSTSKATSSGSSMNLTLAFP